MTQLKIPWRVAGGLAAVGRSVGGKPGGKKQMSKKTGKKSKAKRKAKTRTSTKRKKKSDGSEMQSSHDDMDAAVVKSHIRSKPIPNTKQNMNYTVIKNYKLTGTTGEQMVEELASFYTRDQIMGVISTDGNGKTNPGRWGDDPYLFNPVKGISSDGNVYTVDGKYLNTTTLVSHKVNEEYYILNAQNVPVNITIWWLMCKKDNDFGPIECWKRAKADAGAYQRAAVGRTTYGSFVTSGASAAVEEYGDLPFRYKEFNKSWKAIAKHQFILQGGNQRKIRISHNLKRNIRRESFENNDNGVLAGYTIVPMLIAKCGLVEFEQQEGSSNEFSFAKPALGAITKQRFKFGFHNSQTFSNERLYDGHLVRLTDAFVQKHIDDEDQVAPVQTLLP